MSAGWTWPALAALCGAVGGGALVLLLTAGGRRYLTALRRWADAVGPVHVPDPPRGDGPFGAVELATSLRDAARRLEQGMHDLREEGARLAAVLASMGEGVLACDAEERVLLINAAAARFLGVDAERAAGRPFDELARHGELRAMLTAGLHASAVEGEISIADDAGGERALQVRCTPLRAADGRARGALLVLADITRLRRLEVVRRDFVANVSHEIRTPVTAIKGFVETLQDGGLRDPEQAARFLAIIARQVDRLNAIVEDLLALSRLEQDAETAAIPRERAALAAVLRSAVEACRFHAEERCVAVAVDCPDDLAAEVNAPLLEQAVVNLVDNAVKYSEAGGRVDVTARSERGELVIRVRDEGCGIEEQHLPRLFERFYRVDKARSRKLGGTGLGLAIVKHVAQAHRGRVAVESSPGRGSTFAIALPGANEELTKS